MKLIFQDLTSPPLLYKCGAELIAIGALSGASTIGNIASTVMTNSANKSMANAQLQLQQEENALNRAWQTEEAEVNRQFQHREADIARKFTQGEREASQLYQSQQWQHQFDEELAHRFDVPNGVNPAVYFSSHGAASGTGGSVGAPSGISPSVPNGSMPGTVGGLSPVPYQAQRLDFPQMIESVGNFMNSLASANKQGAETKEIMSLLSEKVRTAIANSDTAEALAGLNQIYLQVEKSNMPWKLKQAAADYRKTVSEITLNKEKALTEKQIQSLDSATTRLQDALSNLRSKEAERLGLEMPFVVSSVTASIKQMHAQAAKDVATAKNESALADLHNWEVSFSRSTQDYTISRLDQELRNLEKQGSILYWQVGAAEAAYDLQRNTADHAEELFWKDFVLDVVTGGVDAFTSIRNSRSWSRMSDASQRRVDARLKEIENQYGDKVELIDKSSSGKVRKRTYRRPYQKYGDTTD